MKYPNEDNNSNYIGGAWKKQSVDGTIYLSATIIIDDKKRKITIYPIKEKSKENSPDFIITEKKYINLEI